MAEKIAVIGEVYEGNLRPITLECLAAAENLSEDGEIIIIFCGEKPTEIICQEISYYSAAKIVWTSLDKKERIVEMYNSCLQKIIEKEKPTKIIFGNTEFGKAVAPYISEKLSFPLFSNVMDLQRKDNAMRATMPVFSGKLHQIINIDFPQFIITLKPNSFKMPMKKEQKNIPIEEMKIDKKAPIFPLIQMEKSSESRKDLLDAKVIVAGGRGLQNEEGYHLLQQLASLVDGTVGVSRGAVDLGVADISLLIGQTGKTVSPDIYIACGISGAIQHIVGMNAAKTVVAINNDQKAPIFEEADYGVVGDIFEVLPALIKELESYK
ncbi:electron transfer flavoprotein subunit alpha/FixB family protein [Niallia sp. NCCP-28]|uniref:electron transfer flavoprotein subunit alpha/FixB family protein n=1 Tax=Niallia sp. NCCP-28 TaxID=2934712 RepID=UPI00208BF170|nr:electron transfer flavoprotein subunit alpha/FixB family protein [Niallia sp. NCCP-28]GKU81511.1 electron transfer flavoprotein subunit alpha [Niallia sp. NCCP-28]